MRTTPPLCAPGGVVLGTAAPPSFASGGAVGVCPPLCSFQNGPARLRHAVACNGATASTPLVWGRVVSDTDPPATRFCQGGATRPTAPSVTHT